MVTLSLDTHLSLFMVTSLGRSTIRYPTTWVPWTNVISPQRGTKSKKRKRSTMMVELDKNRKLYKQVKTEKITTQKQLEKINNEVDDKYKCSICYEHDRTVVFLPCKHLCCCANCGKVDVTLNCPICREDINSRINIFL